MRRIILLLAIILPIATIAQQQKIDSLRRYISHLEANDSIAKATAKIMDLADMYEYAAQWDKHDSCVKVTMKYAKQLDDKGFLAEVYNKIGISYCIRGEKELSITNMKKGLELSFELDDTSRIAIFHENLGLVYKDMGLFEKAMDHQVKALEIREKYNFLDRLPHTYSNISQLWDFMGDTAKQWEYLMKAKEAEKLLPPDHALAATLCCEVGEALLDRKQYSEAKKQFEDGLAHCEAVDWQYGISVFIADLANLFEASKNWGQAKEMHKKSLQTSIMADNFSGICQEYTSIAKCYLQLNMLDSARIMVDSALIITQKGTVNKEHADALHAASDIYKASGLYRRALDYLQDYTVLNDSISGVEKSKNITELETKYETEKKEQQIELLSAENKIKNQRNVLFVVLTIALFLALVVAVLLFYRSRKQNQQKQESLRQQLLRSQMNPHFLFNALGSIQNYMFNNKPREASSYLNNFASLTRAILNHSAAETVTLDEEIAALDNFIKLEQMRLQHRFSYEIKYDKSLETEFIEIPPMLIQPFVENAIKHGLQHKENGTLEITIEDCTDTLKVNVIDNGAGFDETAPKSNGHKSMAMDIFNQRMTLIKKKYGKKAEANIRSQKDVGTEASLVIPLAG